MSKIAVVLFNLGGPDTLAAVRPFLFNLFNDPAILRMPKVLRYLLAKLISGLRANKARGIYARMGGGSPLLPNTVAQAKALGAALIAEGMDARVFVCMRYWHPMSAEVVQEVFDFAPDEIVLLPLYPQFSTTTTGSSIDDWNKAWQTAGLSSIPTHSIGCYPTDTNLVAAFADLSMPLINEALAHVRPMILLSAHGLPQSIVDAGDPYQCQVEQTAMHIERELRVRFGDVFDTTICYQSRVGPKKWIEPSTDTVIKGAAAQKRPIIVVPVAFVSDHSETLVELDQDYRDLALANGASFYGRVPSLACHPLFIKALILRIQKALRKDKCENLCKDDMICFCKNVLESSSR
ncbi:MAG: ferrochelatase [Pseudomonadota bacterium]